MDMQLIINLLNQFDYCQTPGLVFRLGVDFVLTLSHEEQKEQEEPPTKKLSCYWPDFDDTLKVASWEHLEQILTVMVTFIQATFVQVTFDHISNISAVTDTILMKLKW